MISNPPLRQVAVCIETTGIDPVESHRVVEIAAVEIIDRRLTGRYFHTYLNPEQDIEIAAQAVHGLSWEMLKDKPVFAEIALAFIDFVKGAELVAHNAPFDIGFLNQELMKAKLDSLDSYCPKLIDTLDLAKARRPDNKNTLTALCEDFSIPIEADTNAGCLMDANALAKLFLVLGPHVLH
jgi:DNA polymerase-3 subunit epsilon